MKNFFVIFAAVVIVLTSNYASAQTHGTFKPSVEKETFNVGKLVQIDINFFSNEGLRFYGKGLLDKYIIIKDGIVYANPCCDKPVIIRVDSNDGSFATYHMKPGAEKIVLAQTNRKAQISVNF